MKIDLATSFACALAMFTMLLGPACSDAGNTSAPVTIPPAQAGETVTTPLGLKYTILVAGTGAVARPGHAVVVNYTGTLTNGVVFDTSIGRAPFTFILGSGQVILGWNQGVAGMKVGEKRKLVIPAELAYGSSQVGSIPPNSVLTFIIDLLDVK